MSTARSHRSIPGKAQDAASPRRLSILLIDEDATARAVVARRLAHRGHDVIAADSGHAGVALLSTRPFDIILIDMGLAILPGIATMKKIRAAGLAGQASFVMIAGRQDNASVVEALEAGADDYVTKPFDFDVLDARLRHLCQRADELNALTRHNAELDARIARRAVELGETRDALQELQLDRARLVSSIQALNDEIARLSAART